MGSFLNGNHWGQPAAFSAALLSIAGPDSRTIFSVYVCVFVFGGVREGPLLCKRDHKALMLNAEPLVTFDVLIFFGLLFILGCN